jgi:hypothetical protein
VLETPLTDKPWALLTYCVETEEGALATSERLGAMTKPMLRLRPDGSELTWRVAAMSRFKEEGRASKPFFITWDDPSVRPDKVRTSDTSTMPLHLIQDTLGCVKHACGEKTPHTLSNARMCCLISEGQSPLPLTGPTICVPLWFIAAVCRVIALSLMIISVISQLPAPHKVQPQGIEYIELAGDKKTTEEWIGTDKLPLQWVEGTPGIKAVGIRTAAGMIELR